MQRVTSLDGLRGLAVFLVLASHSSNAGYDVVPGLDARGVGRAGVFLFFVLSSYLLTGQCLDAFDEGRARGASGLRYWLRFGARRLLRIVPAYALTLGLYVALGAFTPEVALRHLALLRAEAHFWTIPVEVLFYLALPVMTPLLGAVRGVGARLGVVLAMAVLARLAFPPDYPARPPDFTPHVAPFLPVFLVGSALAVVRPWITHLAARRLRWLDGLAAVAALALLALAPAVFERIRGQPVHHTHFHLDFDAFGLLFGAVVLATIPSKPGLVARAASFRPLVGLGIVSYSVYLLHAIVLAFVQSKSAALGAWVGPLSLAGAVAAGTASFLVVERPFLRVLRGAHPVPSDPPA